MYYTKTRAARAKRKGKITLSDFSPGMDTAVDEELLPLPRCAESFNFDYSGGVLKDGEGIKTARFGANGTCPSFEVPKVLPLAVFYYKKYDVSEQKNYNYFLIYGSDGKMYSALTEHSLFTVVNGLTFENVPKATAYNYDGEDVLVFSDGATMKIYDGTKVVAVSDVPAITSMCIHNERLFVTESKNKTSLWFSDDFDPTNWKISLDQAGFINLVGGGNLLKVVSFGGYLYVFAEYAVFRVIAYADQTQFSAEKIVASAGRIFENTVTPCGDRIIYLAEDGFYAFSGGAPQRILKRLDNALTGKPDKTCKGNYYNGKYYCLIDLETIEGTERVMLVYDIRSATFNLMRNLCVSDFILADGEDGSELLFLVRDKSRICTLSKKAELCSIPLVKRWISGKTDLNVGTEKTITKVSLSTSGAIDVFLKSEAGSRLLHFSGGNKEQTVPVGLRGNTFKIEIQSVVPCSRISGVKISYEYYAEG